MKRAQINVLWILVGFASVALLLQDAFALPSIIIPITLLIEVSFILFHGALRYRWSGMAMFIIICLVVSNILENTSILTGFPFGHYHYTDSLGPKLFLVPLLIGPSYVATGYLAWVLGTVLLGDVRRESSAFMTFAVPFVASFIMVAWDLCFDPKLSTIGHAWIWEDGGAYFGVPLTNYLGWFFTVYIFFQLFAFFLRLRKAPSGATLSLPRSYDAQAVVVYAMIGVSYVVAYLVWGSDQQVTDVTGAVWHTASIAESTAIVSIFTMIFMAALATVRLLQRSADVTNTAVKADTSESLTRSYAQLMK